MSVVLERRPTRGTRVVSVQMNGESVHRRSIVGRLRSAFSTRRRRAAQGTGRSRSGSALLLATFALVALSGTAASAASVGFVQAHKDGLLGVDGLDGAQSIAVSPDGLHVYAGGSRDDAIAIFARNATGLTFVSPIVKNNVGGVTGLDRVRGLALSPNGAHLYAAGYDNNAVAVFSRNATTGALTFVEAKLDGSGGATGLAGAHGVAVSPDGAHVYAVAAIDAAITVFSRNAATGALTVVETIVEGGLNTRLAGAESVTVSPDGAHVYVAAQDDNAVSVFARNATTGKLTYVEAKVDGTGGVDGLNTCQAVSVSPDGAHVYTAGAGNDNAVAVFSRNPTTGALTFSQVYKDGVGGIDGLAGAEWVMVSHDGTTVFAVGDVDNALVVFNRNTSTGALTMVQLHRDNVSGVDGLGGAASLVVSPDNNRVYVASTVENAVAVFANLCGNGQFDPGEQCDDGNTVNGDCCSATCTQEPAGSPCADDGNLCTDDKCNGVGLCLHVNNTLPCDDGLYCTVNDTCSNRECVGAARDCSAVGFECHPGVCNEASDQCVAQQASDGSPCDEGNACTLTDVCIAGACVGQNPVICAALDQCHIAGACNPATGECSQPLKADGSPCDDGDGCTQTDTCQAGVCVGANPVVCTQEDQCHVVGTCDPATGVCSNPTKADGTACDDGDACTRADSCNAGVCVGSDPVTCTAQDQCHVAGTCDPLTGVCSNPTKANGTACNDGSLCTQSDTCQAGACVGASPIVCTAQDQCHVAGTCDPATGVCSNPPKADGAVCDDGDHCTQLDVCLTGICAGGDPVVCAPLDGCHVAGACDPATGVCSDPLAADGTGCDDGNGCTQTDACLAGACVGSNPVVCRASDQCHSVGTCDPATGVCSDPSLADGTPCDDASLCTAMDICVGGACTGQNPVVCPAPAPCHAPRVCDPGTGLCSDEVLPDGSACDDGDGCTRTDLCLAGVCVGGDPVTCVAQDQCHVAGVCDPATGVCSNPPQTDGTACDDGNFCTRSDACAAGACVGTDPIACTVQDQCHTLGVCDPATGVCSNPAAVDGTA